MNFETLDEKTELDPIVENRIQRGSAENYKTSLQYKGLASRHDRQVASITYDIKRARAAWDPDLGPSGGWRCPVGTRYGGQITDRYGRNCGWGVVRRIANAITDTGERMERGLDRRRARRVRKRNERTLRQIGKPAERIARQAERAAGRAVRPQRPATTPREQPSVPRTRRGSGVPERMERTAREVLEGTFLENRRARRAARNAQNARTQQTAPRVQRQRRGRGIPESMERMAREVLEGTFLENRRRRRETERNRRTRAQAERVTPSTRTPSRPSVPTRPAGTVVRPTRRRGPRIDPGQPNSERRRKVNSLLSDETQKNQDWWRTRLHSKAVNAENIRKYIEERENRPNQNPAYLNTLRARERDHEILTGANPHQRIDDLSPTVRTRINKRLRETETPQTPTPARPSTPPTPRPRPRPRSGVPTIQDVSDDPEVRRSVQRDVKRKIEISRRGFARARSDAATNSDDARLDEAARGMAERVQRLRASAADPNRNLAQRYEDHQLANHLEKEIEEHKRTAEKIRSIAAERRRRSEEEAAQAARPEPETPRQPRPQTPNRRVQTFGLDENTRAELDRFLKDDQRQHRNIQQESQRALTAGRTNLFDRRLRESEELVSSYEESINNENASPEDRYLASRGIDEARAHRDALRQIKKDHDARQAQRAASQAERSAEPETPNPSEEEGPDEAEIQKLKDAFKERVAEVTEKRAKIVRKYFKKRYGDGPAPWLDDTKNISAPESKRLMEIALGPASPEQRAARAKLEQWARQIYEIPEFEAKDGKLFKTQISEVRFMPDGGLHVGGSILVEENGRWRNIGQIGRTLKLTSYDTTQRQFVQNWTPYVSNGLLKIENENYKKYGFATTYNSHAFTWLKAAGFDHASVGTAWDGVFVWGKLGYRANRSDSIVVARELEAELNKIERGGRSSVINKRDAKVIRMLIDEAKRRDYAEDAPSHADYLMAMRNRDNARVKGWFINNAPFSGGKFYFRDIPDDPRK